MVPQQEGKELVMETPSSCLQALACLLTSHLLSLRPFLSSSHPPSPSLDLSLTGFHPHLHRHIFILQDLLP